VYYIVTAHLADDAVKQDGFYYLGFQGWQARHRVMITTGTPTHVVDHYPVPQGECGVFGGWRYVVCSYTEDLHQAMLRARGQFPRQALQPNTMHGTDAQRLRTDITHSFDVIQFRGAVVKPAAQWKPRWTSLETYQQRLTTEPVSTVAQQMQTDARSEGFALVELSALIRRLQCGSLIETLS